MAVKVIGVLLIVMGIFLIISVLMQSSKNHRVSGSIAGGAETFFGKQKGRTLDALFNKLTTIVTILFVILTLALCFMLPTLQEIEEEQNAEYEKMYQEMLDAANAEADDDAEEPDTADAADDTADDEGEDAETADDTADGEGETADGEEVQEDVQNDAEDTDEPAADGEEADGETDAE